MAGGHGENRLRSAIGLFGRSVDYDMEFEPDTENMFIPKQTD